MTFKHQNTNKSIIFLQCPKDIVRRIALSLDLRSMVNLIQVCSGMAGEFNNDTTLWTSLKNRFEDQKICECCRRMYVIKDNHKRACFYHPRPGVAPPADMWGGHAVGPHQCCGGANFSKGCTPTPHVPLKNSTTSVFSTFTLKKWIMTPKDVCRKIVTEFHSVTIGQTCRYVLDGSI